MSCVYKIGDRSVSLDQLEAFIRQRADGLFQKKSSKQWASEILTRHNRLRFDEADHKYFLDGEELTSVSRTIDTFKGYAFDGTPSGDEAAELGTEVHAYLESLIKRKAEPKNNFPREFKEQAKAFMNALRDKGGELLSEVRVYDEEKKVAGMVDLVHILPDGSVDVYDFKNALESSYKRAKAQAGERSEIWSKEDFKGYKDKRYSMQLRMYERLLERSHPGLKVNRSYVVPIEVRKNEAMSEVESFTMLEPEDIRKYTYFKLSNNNVHAVFGEEIKYGYELGKTNKSFGIMTALLGEEFEEDHLSTEDHARRVARNSEGKESFINALGEEILFDSDNFESRVKQIAEDRREVLEYRRKHLAPSAIKYFETGETSSLIGGYEMEQRLKKLFAPYQHKDNVKMHVLSDLVKGLEEFSDVILVEHDGVTDLLQIGSHTKQFKMPGRRKTILGHYMDDYQAEEKHNIKLGNTKAAANMLQMGLILPHLKSINPDLQLGRMVSVDPYAKDMPTVHEQAYTLLPQLSTILSLPSIRAQITDEMLEMYNEETLRPEAYQQNHLYSLLSFLQSTAADDLTGKGKQLSDYMRAKMKDKVQQYLDAKEDNEEVISLVEDRLKQLLKYFKGTPMEQMRSNPEFVNLSFALMQLKGVKDLYNPEDILTLPSWVNTKEKTGIPLLNFLAKTFDNAVNAVRDRFLRDYKNEGELMFERLMKDYQQRYDSLGSFKDRGLSDMARYFEPLLRKEAGNQLLEFHVKGTKEYEALSDTQKEFIEWYSGKIEQGWERILGKTKYATKVKEGKINPRQIPIIKASYGRRFINAGKQGGIATREGRQLYKTAWKAYMDRFLDFREVHTDENKDLREIPDAFSAQLQASERKRMLGQQEDLSYSADVQAGLETNLEVIMDIFQMQSLRREVMGDVLPYTHAVAAVLKTVGEEGFVLGDNKNAVDMVDRLTQMVAVGGTVKAKTKTEQMAEKAIGNAGFFASVFLLGLNFTAAFVNALQMGTASLSAAISNALGVENKMFGAEIAKGIFTVPSRKEMHRMAAVMKTYGMGGADMSALQNNFRQTRKTWLRSDFFFKLMSVSDVTLRSAAMKAQMIKDGTWEAHTVKEKTVDGITVYELHYDEDKDLRFKADPKAGRTQAQAEAFREFLRAQLKKEGKVDENGRMLVAYDNNMRNQRKNYFDSIYDAFDKEARNTLDVTAWGKALMMFKRFMVSKYERLWKARQPFSGSAYSDYRMVTREDGRIDFEWQDGTIEGIMQSVYHLFMESRLELQKAMRGEDWNNPWQEMQEFRKDNLRRLITDLSLASLLAIVGHTLAADKDDDEEKGEYMRGVLMRSVTDLMATYNPLVYLQMGVMPMAAISYADRVGSSLAYLVSNPTADQAERTLHAMVPATRQAADMLNSFGYSDEK